MGSRNDDRIPLIARRRHGETVADMIANGWDVYAQCRIPRCGCRLRVDLQRVARVLGPAYSLWDKPQRCRGVGCKDVMDLWAKAPGMAFHEPLVTVKLPDELPAYRRGREPR